MKDNIKPNKNININENKKFKELWELSYCYPIYPNHIEGEMLLLYITSYLLSKKIIFLLYIQIIYQILIMKPVLKMVKDISEI